MALDVNNPLLQRPQVRCVRSGPLWTLEKTNIKASLRDNIGLALMQVNFVLSQLMKGEN